ncbi:MAG: DUF2079 domain-containing protein [Candidatus Izemoplasmatales bacterium]
MGYLFNKFFNGFNKKYLLISIISSFVTSFFIAASVALVKYDILRNYYNVRLVELAEFKLFLFIFIISFILIFLISWRFLTQQLVLVVSLFWLVFLIIFSYYSPTSSLVIGALISSIPAIFLSMTKSIDNLEKSVKMKEKILNLTIQALNIFIFLVIILIYFEKTKIDYVLPATLNLSNITNDIIYAQHMMDRWNIFLYVFAGLVITYSIILLLFRYKPSVKIPFKKISIIIITVALITQITALSIAMVYRLKVLGTSTYDFGIFIQMFNNMKSLNGMVTTLERSVVLTHLKVHFSPIYYLMLPIYVLFPNPSTLQIIQVLVVASGIIPLWLITKESKTNSFIRFVIMVVYILSPALITSSFYDLHENCFLAPLILFVLYFAIKKNTIFFIVFSILTLLIKEDSSLYLFFIGLYLTFSTLFVNTKKKDVKTIFYGIGLLISSLLYFLVITNYLNSSGDGAMFWRYNNLNIDSDMGLFGIVTGFLLNPSYYLATLFTPQKINTILILLGSVGFLPFFVKNLASYFLLVPVIIINYITTYPYQHQFGFQYFYGSAVLIIFMVLLAEKDHQNNMGFSSKINHFNLINFLGLLAIAVSSVHGISYIAERVQIVETYNNKKEVYNEMKEFLINFPEEKKVVATGYLTPYLADRYYLYDYSYYDLSDSEVEIDYIIVDGRIASEKLEDIVVNINNNGFVESTLSTEYILVYEPSE